MKIVDITQTCGACPAQWEGKLDDGRMIYVRYRWGHLSARVSPKSTDEVMEAVDGRSIVDECVGDGLDGVIEWDRVVPYLTRAGVEVSV